MLWIAEKRRRHILGVPKPFKNGIKPYAGYAMAKLATASGALGSRATTMSAYPKEARG